MPKATPPTKPSPPKLSDLAQHVVVPKGTVATGWPAVQEKCRHLGISFRPWQPDVGRLILAKRGDGKYAATIGGTGLSIPRQVGKTFLVGAIVFALCLLRPKLTVIWTAHRVRTAEETFGKMQAFAARAKIKPHILKIVLGSGDEAILFRNGSRILFGARDAGFGLGFDEVDVLIFDEAQRLKDSTLDDMIPATNQSRQDTGALLLFMGTPPRPTDSGEVFTRMRAEVLTGEDEDTGWVEFGSDPDHEPAPPPAALTKADWEQIAKANPSYPLDTPREAILRMRKKLGHESFMREGMGRWDVEGTGLILPRWSNRVSRAKEPPPLVAIGLAVSLNEEWGSIAACGFYDDRPHLAPSDRREGSGWLVTEAKRIQVEHGCAVVIDEKCPDKALIRALVDEGVDLTVAKLEDNIETCSELRNRVRTSDVTHSNHHWLNEAFANARWRSVGDGRKLLGRKQSAGDIDMAEAAVMALHGALAGANYDVLDSIF